MKTFLVLAIAILTFAGCSSGREEREIGTRSFSPHGEYEREQYEGEAYQRSRMNAPHNTPAPRRTTRFRSNNATSNAHFETSYDATDTDRGTNIALATASINGAVVKPGEEFSFNGTIGSTTEKYGYKKSVVFVDGEKSESYGGGVCQVSTTLCNAAVSAGMTITERHDHSLPVQYVKDGIEAATSNRGDLDFKFVNDKPYPVKIHAHAHGGVVSVSLENLNNTTER